jgi:hypothetical protein
MQNHSWLFHPVRSVPSIIHPAGVIVCRQFTSPIARDRAYHVLGQMVQKLFCEEFSLKKAIILYHLSESQAILCPKLSLSMLNVDPIIPYFGTYNVSNSKLGFVLCSVYNLLLNPRNKKIIRFGPIENFKN